MANANTIVSLQGGTKRNQIPALVVSTTTETVFTLNQDAGAGLGVAVVAVPSSSAIVGSSTPLDPSANPAIAISTGRQYGPQAGTDRPYAPIFDGGLPFTVRVAGTFTSGVAANDLKISLYQGSSATVSSDHLITAALTTGTSGNFGAVSGNFLLEVVMVWDSTSGYINSIVNEAIIGPAAVTPTYISPAKGTQVAAAAVANLTFVASATWNAANAGNTVQVSEFSISQN